MEIDFDNLRLQIADTYNSIVTKLSSKDIAINKEIKDLRNQIIFLLCCHDNNINDLSDNAKILKDLNVKLDNDELSCDSCGSIHDVISICSKCQGIG